MERHLYLYEFNSMREGWWYIGRRQLFGDILMSYGVDSSARCLDVGSCSGTNLLMLKQIGVVDFVGVDMDKEVQEYCRQTGLGRVEVGDACSLDHPGKSFDIALATDVLEHIDDDTTAAKELFRVLAPGGVALITVPAFKILWGPNDTQKHHKRRYRKSQIESVLKDAGLEVEESFFFNFILFFPILFFRLMARWIGDESIKEGEVIGPIANRLLVPLFWLDIKLARYIRVPFGVSLCVVARRPKTKALK